MLSSPPTVHIVTTIGAETGLFLFSNATNPCTLTRRTPTRVHTRIATSTHITSERKFAQRLCACVIVELEHEYIRKVNVRTNSMTNRQTKSPYTASCGSRSGSPQLLKLCILPYSRKIWRGIKFGALADRPTDRQIKIRQYLIRVYTYVRKINNGCGRSRASARARAHCRSQLFFDVHARRCKILLLLTMSLYRFFTKAGMPSRVPSLTDKEIVNANTSTYVWIERARGRGYIAT